MSYFKDNRGIFKVIAQKNTIKNEFGQTTISRQDESFNDNIWEQVYGKVQNYSNNLEELEDMQLLRLAEDRIRNFSGKVYTQEEVMKELGITDEELDSMEDVEIE